MVFCCCGCVPKPCSLCLAGSLAARCDKHAKKAKKLKSFSFSRVSEGALGTFLRFRCYVLGTKLSHAACAWQARWLQDVANMRKKLKKLKGFSFSRVSEGALGFFFAFPLLRCGHEIRWCFAVADASQRHAACAWRLGRLAGCKIWQTCVKS